MTTYVQRCLIVPAAYAPLARALCAGLSEGAAGDGMLATPVSVTGTLPATHFIAAGMIEDTLAGLLPLGDEPGQPETITALAAGAVTLAQVKALLSAISVTEEQPFTAMARMSLKLIQEAL